MSLADLDRRELMRGAGALILGLQAPLFAGRAAAQTAADMLTAWVRISSDDRVTLILSQIEIGQGISTTLYRKPKVACADDAYCAKPKRQPPSTYLHRMTRIKRG